MNQARHQPAEHSRPAPGAGRRGMAGAAAVLLLLIVQLLVVGAVLTVVRDNNLTSLRLDTLRAFYAAEAGANMAIREAMVGLDEDGDGTIGSISNDGNAANDPQLVTARVVASRQLVGAMTMISSNARCGLARRKADAEVQGVIGGSPQTVMAAFGRNGSNQPRFSTWSGGAWTASAAMPSIGGQAKWVRMKICPTRNETTFIAEDLNKRVTVCFFNGSTWGTVSLLSSDTGGLNDRPEDIAYEQLSSEALCVYWKGTSSSFGFRTYNGAVFSSEQSLSSPFSTECDFVTLYPRPSSDQILLLAADGIAGNPLKAALWDGSAFGAWVTMVNSLVSNNEECYSAAFESQTGRGVAVYSETGQNQPRYRTLTGSAWSAQASLPTIGAVAKWIRLAADPTSNSILFAALDSSDDLNANVWDGTSWGTNTELATDATTSDRRQFDVIYERGTGHALIVYGRSGSNVVRYRTWNGSAWSPEQSGPNLGSTVEIVTLSRGFGNGEVFVAVSDSLRRLHLMRWDGASMSGDTVIEASLSGWAQYYSFAVPEPTVAPHPRVRSWTEVAP